MRSLVLLSVLLTVSAAAAEDRYFTIRVVDAETGRGVPLVELQTVNAIRYVTDSHGVAAVDEPGLAGQRVYFHIRSHGYEYPKDGFGFRGAALTVTPGGSATLKLPRVNLAERLYRVTGGGIYRDSVLAGRPVPIREPLLNAQVFGSDSVMNAVYGGKLYWFWGDTNRPSYPLGNFHTPGATSELPASGGLAPDVGVNLSYFVDETGFAKSTARMPGDGPTWISGLVVLTDETGRETMFTGYAKIDPPLDAYARGLARWNDERQQFEHVVTFEGDPPLHPTGHTFLHRDGGTEYVYFCNPLPQVRVRATAEHLQRPDEYEAFTCLKEGSPLDRPEFDRDADGRLRYSWKPNTPVVGPAEQQKFLKEGLLQPDDVLLRLRDRDTGRPVQAHSGSVYWNEFRRRWVLIAVELFGSTSVLGEVWYAEADTPLGPWAYAVKVVTHDRYSFYNPKQHPLFDQQDGRVIFFEGTYTHTFSGNPEPTPRYDYNQIMYKLDLGDPRAVLPVPVYAAADEPPCRFHTGQTRDDFDWDTIHFFAPDRPFQDALPVYATTTDAGHPRLQVGPPDERSTPLFYALPADHPSPPTTMRPLYEFHNPDTGRYAYSTDGDWSRPGFARSESPLGLVWSTPVQ